MQIDAFKSPSGWLAGLAFWGVVCWCATAQAQQLRIVAIGDSQFAGKGVARSETYPAKLETALRAKGENVTVANAGINGDTTSGVLARLDSAVPNGTILAIVSVGANDIVLHGASTDGVATNLNAIKSRLTARGIESLILPYGRKFQGDLFDKPEYHVEKVHSATNTEWHLNAAGYEVIVARTLPQVLAALSNAKSRRKP
jgi:lysophospholipase L1-like esterase